MTVPEETEFLDRWIPTLPQASVIEPDHALAWRKATAAIEPDRFEWHFRRLQGIGGSEIGEFAATRLGVPAQFKTVEDIVRGKLMMRAPEPPDAVMRRGIVMEPVVRALFRADYGAEPVDIGATLVGDAHPWMAGNMDDVVRIDGRTYIVDYKAPGEVETKVALQYAAQVHQYGHLFAEKTGEEFPGLLVVQFDYCKGLTRPTEIPFDAVLMDAVIEGGDEGWSSVLAGRVPSPVVVEAPSLDLSDADRARLRILEEQWLLRKLLADAAADRLKGVKKEIDDLLTGGGERLVKGSKPPMEMATLSARRFLKPDEADRIAAASGLPRGEFESDTDKFDQVAMAAALRAYGEDPDRYRIRVLDLDKVVGYAAERGIALPVRETISVALPRKKKYKEIVAEAKGSAAEHIDAATDALAAEFERDEEADVSAPS